jgi:hypothetical protein
MKSRSLLALGLLVTVVVFVDRTTQDPQRTATNVRQVPASAAPSGGPDREPPPSDRAAAPRAFPVAAPVRNADATRALSAAREQGDDRAPPFVPEREADAVLRPSPSNDPSAFVAQEQAAAVSLRRRFTQAADAALPQWRAAIETARGQGASAQALQRAEEKVRRLESTRQALGNESP